MASRCSKHGESNCIKCSPNYGSESLLGQATTRDLLLELALRGDLAMVALPTTERAADGAALSALAGALIKSSAKETLEAKRGE